MFDGYVRYIKGDITFLHYSISQYISYAPQSYIISKAPDQELYDGVPVIWYCKIPIKNEILTNVKIPYSDFIKNIAKFGGIPPPSFVGGFPGEFPRLLR